MRKFSELGEKVDQAVNRTVTKAKGAADRAREVVADVRTTVADLSLQAALERVASEYGITVTEARRRLQNQDKSASA